MIEPRLLTLQDMFGDRVHYEVPIYQRSYVWARDEQWEPLWEDVSSVATRRLEKSTTLAHFLGAIVIELISSEPGRVKRFSVIDGQQRLTTLQVLLAALRSIAEQRDPDRVGDLARLLYNEGRHTSGDLKYKVSPSAHDKPYFRAAVDAEAVAEANGEGIQGALAFFADRINKWIDRGPPGDVQDRLDALQDTLDGLIQVVAIQLDGGSDAQVIFETLNSRGADLTSLDLAKNALLQQARREGDNEAELHAKHWEPVFGDADYWLETVRQGRYTRERADLFLMHWLTMWTGTTPRVQHLFADFRRDVLRAEPPLSATELIVALGKYAALYRSFESFDSLTVEGRFFSRLERMDTTTLMPVALLLFGAEELTEGRRRRALRALESWLVRRMTLGATTQHYNRLLAALLSTLREQPTLDDADDIIIEALQNFENPTDRWPTDDDIRSRLIEQPIYGWINQRRIRLLLEACEEQMAASAKSEQITVPTGLTVEHALPQNWQKNWPLEEGSEEAAEIRDAHVHRLGNLTLVTHALNSSLSDSAWTKKRVELAKRSQLLVNQRLCNHEVWNEELIDARGLELANYVIATWPGPDADWVALPE